MIFYGIWVFIRILGVIFVSSRGGSTTFCGKKIVLEYFHCLVTIEYFRLNIEYLSLRLVDPTARRGILSILKRTERSDIHKYSICNLQ